MDSSFPPLWELTLTCNLETLPSPHPSMCFQVMLPPPPPPRVTQPAPPIPRITVLVPGGHVIQAGLITVLFVTSSGNAGKTLESKSVAQEAAGSHFVNSI